LFGVDDSDKVSRLSAAFATSTTKAALDVRAFAGLDECLNLTQRGTDYGAREDVRRREAMSDDAKFILGIG
jgi:hypothetical protein